MTINVKTPEEYISKVPEERKEAISKLRETVKTNLPNGFEECINYGMIGYVVPHSLYPDGYHCDPKSPLPFANIASQKNFVALYHSAIYADKEIHDWFVGEYPKHVSTKLDMGKSHRFTTECGGSQMRMVKAAIMDMICKKWMTNLRTRTFRSLRAVR